MSSEKKHDNVPLSIEEVLKLDAEYRQAASEGRLKMIAPKEHNPTGEGWLPIMWKRLDGARATLVFSNTASAHNLGKTNDWVVLYFKPTGREETQCTVVTEWHKGPLEGRRVVRGREKETLEYYEAIEMARVS
jgi:DNA polymerase (family 10)